MPEPQPKNGAKTKRPGRKERMRAAQGSDINYLTKPTDTTRPKLTRAEKDSKHGSGRAARRAALKTKTQGSQPVQDENWDVAMGDGNEVEESAKPDDRKKLAFSFNDMSFLMPYRPRPGL